MIFLNLEKVHHMNEELIIGSRGSDLALWQSRWVKSQLERHHPELSVKIEVIQTKGDNILDVALSKIGGKGLFTKALEDKLLDGSIDLAVHSLKDLPTILPQGLSIAAITEREDPRDVFISKNGSFLKDLPENAKIATGSLRRQSQLLNFRRDFMIQDLRGNVPTRIAKLHDNEWDGIILARAGLKRLEMLHEASETIDEDIMLPAVGQGALGIETRDRDFQMQAILAPLNHADSAASTTAERALLRKLEGGCQVPIGAYGRVTSGELRLKAYAGSLTGHQSVRGSISGSPDDADSIGVQLANQLLRDGADKILRDVRRAVENNE